MSVILSPGESYSILMRVEIRNKVGMLGKVASAIGEAGGGHRCRGPLGGVQGGRADVLGLRRDSPGVEAP
jgi:hypothetical protein